MGCESGYIETTNRDKFIENNNQYQSDVNDQIEGVDTIHEINEEADDNSLSISDDSAANSHQDDFRDECPICSKKLLHVSKHMKRMHKIKNENVESFRSECFKCNRNVYKLEDHVGKCNGNGNNISCPICSLSIQRRSLPNHTRRLHNIIMKKHKCLKCNKEVFDLLHHDQFCKANCAEKVGITCPVCLKKILRRSFARHDHTKASAASPATCEYERMRDLRVKEIR